MCKSPAAIRRSTVDCRWFRYIPVIYTGLVPAKPKSAARAPEPHQARAKLFRNGRSQAVRIPKEFRMPGDEVIIQREGEVIILRPTRARNGWPAGYWEKLDRLTRNLGAGFELPEDPVPPPIKPQLAR